MRNTFPEIILVPGGASAYDIDGETAGITNMVTALEELVELKFARGGAYRLIGEVNCSTEELGVSPSGQKGYIRKYAFTISGAVATADNAAITTLLNSKGEIYSVYCYDPYTQTSAMVEEGLNGIIDITRNTVSQAVPAWDITVTLQYHGADTRSYIPHTYSA